MNINYFLITIKEILQFLILNFQVTVYIVLINLFHLELCLVKCYVKYCISLANESNFLCYLSLYIYILLVRKRKKRGWPIENMDTKLRKLDGRITRSRSEMYIRLLGGGYK